MMNTKQLILVWVSFLLLMVIAFGGDGVDSSTMIGLASFNAGIWFSAVLGKLK